MSLHNCSLGLPFVQCPLQLSSWKKKTVLSNLSDRCRCVLRVSDQSSGMCGVVASALSLRVVRLLPCRKWVIQWAGRVACSFVQPRTCSLQLWKSKLVAEQQDSQQRRRGEAGGGWLAKRSTPSPLITRQQPKCPWLPYPETPNNNIQILTSLLSCFLGGAPCCFLLRRLW